MVLRPILNSNPPAYPHEAREYASAWDVVARLQHQRAAEYWLIAQTDHAALSGALARALHSPLVPKVTDEVAEAIEVHDHGWAIRELVGGELKVVLNDDGRPESFLDASPAEFVQAWTGSVGHAAGLSALGGMMVSHHFSRLCEHRLSASSDSPEDTALLRQFLIGEQHRQKRLAGATEKALEEISVLVDLLQFCDLLSLYLCAGAAEDAEFPQEFNGRKFRIGYRGGSYAIEPALFAALASFEVPARRFPSRALEVVRLAVR